VCLAISANSGQRSGPIGQAWGRISHNPFRLFVFAAVSHGIVIAGMAKTGIAADGLALSFLILIGLVPLPLLGYALSRMPRWLVQSPVHYGWYFGVFLLVMLALSMLEAGILLGVGWWFGGLLLLALAWVLGIHPLWWMSRMARSRYGTLVRVPSIAMNVIPLTIVMSFGAWMFNAPKAFYETVMAGSVLAYALSLLSLALLYRNHIR